jgi:hypothetical protein
MIGVYHLFNGWDGVSWTFGSEWSWTTILPIFTSWIVGITGVSHCIRLRVVYSCCVGRQKAVWCAMYTSILWVYPVMSILCTVSHGILLLTEWESSGFEKSPTVLFLFFKLITLVVVFVPAFLKKEILWLTHKRYYHKGKWPWTNKEKKKILLMKFFKVSWWLRKVHFKLWRMCRSYWETWMPLCRLYNTLMENVRD